MDHRDHVRLLSGGVNASLGFSRSAAVWADFGSGHGAFTLALADLLGAGGKIHSIDRDRRALSVQAEALRSRFPKVEVDFRVADFSLPQGLPALDGIVMANALHFIEDRRKAALVRLIKGYLKPDGRMILVEYNVDRGNLWVPHPLSFPAWQELAGSCGFRSTILLARAPSSFLHEFYSALSLV